MKQIHNFKIYDLISLFPFLFFVSAIFPYLGQAPVLDPMVIYRESSQFFNGGIKEVVSTGITAHPPLMYSLNSLFFLLFGKNPLSYNLIGILIFFADSLILYFMTKKIFNRKVAIPFVLLLFLNPFVIINSFYLANDMLILSGIIWAIALFIFNKKFLLSLIFVLMVFMKETALVIIGTFFIAYLIEIFVKKDAISKKLKSTYQTAFFFIPAIVVLFIWQTYIKPNGMTEWRETFFSKSNDSSFLIVFKNVFTLKIFNIFLFQNLRNTFIIHFQWVYSLSLIVLAISATGTKTVESVLQKRFALVCFSISFVYIFLVLSFPTWTVPRYSLPVYIGLFFFLALYLAKIKNLISYLLCFTMLLFVAVISNFSSTDPVSLRNSLLKIDGENFYNISFWNSGPDRIIYNTQILKLVVQQNDLIKDAINKNADIIVTYCDSLKLGEKVYSINVHNEFYPYLRTKKQLDCINDYSISQEAIKGRFTNKIIYLKKDEYPNLSQIITNQNIVTAGIVIGK